VIKSSPSWQYNSNLEISIPIATKTERVNPEDLGADLALSRDGDIIIKDGDLAVVNGVNRAIQKMSIVLSTSIGENSFHPKFGSLFRRYYKDYENNYTYLIRFLKLEFSRLSTIPELYDEEENAPLFNFINRVLSIRLENTVPINKRIDIQLILELANNKKWEGNIWVYVGDNSKNTA